MCDPNLNLDFKKEFHEGLKRNYETAINRKKLISHGLDTSYISTKLLGKYNNGLQYHNIFHISKGIDAILEYENATEEDITDVLIAWFYHDVIYDTGPMYINNEKYSAEYAFKDLVNQGFSGNYAGKIYDLIMWTTHKVNPPIENKDACLIVDIDLLGLSDTPGEFNKNGLKIRQEYSHISDFDFYSKRLEFWKHLIKIKSKDFYLTSYFKNKGTIAIDNITKDILDINKFLSNKLEK